MFEFHPEDHTYTNDGKHVVSVTELFDCIATRKKNPDGEYSKWKSVSGSEFIIDDEKTSKFGKELHKIAAYKVLGKNFSYDTVLKPWLKGLDKFLAKYEFEVIDKPENSLYSPKWDYAGTIDLPCMLLIKRPRCHIPCVIDWKSGTYINKKVSRMQTAAYAQLLIENYNIRKRIHRMTVRIFENDYEIDERSHHPQDFNRFISLLNTYKTFA